MSIDPSARLRCRTLPRRKNRSVNSAIRRRALFEALETRDLMAVKFLNFDDVAAPEGFSMQQPLTTQYESTGATFSGVNGDGWKVLNEDSGFGVSGYSAPNFLAWNTFLTSAEEKIDFSLPVKNLSALVGSTQPGTFTATAFDSVGGFLGSSTLVLAGGMQNIALPFENIFSVQFSTTAEYGVLDDLTFQSNIPVTPITAELDAEGNLSITDSFAGNENRLTIATDGTYLLVSDPRVTFLAPPSAASELRDDGKTLAVPMSEVTGLIKIFGGDYDDELLVDYSTGNPVPAGGIQFFGGAGFDAMGIKGSGTQDIVYRPADEEGTDGKKGDLIVDGQVVHFDGLEPVDIVNAGSLTLDTSGIADTLTVSTGTNLTTAISPVIGAQAAIVIAGTTGRDINGVQSAVGIETVAIWNTPTIIINTAVTVGQDGIDAITVSGANGIAANVQNLSIITGAGITDTVNINGAVNLAGSFSIDTVAASSTVAGTISTGTGLSITNTAASTFAGVISGAGALSKAGAGALTLSGANTHTGGTTQSAGNLVVGNNSALGTGTYTVTANATLSQTGAFTLANPVDITGGTLSVAMGGGNLTLNGDISLTGNLQMNSGGNTLTVNGTLSGAGSFSHNSGAGTLIYGGTTTSGFSGGINLGATASAATGFQIPTGATLVTTGTLAASWNKPLTVNGSLTVGTLSFSTNATTTFSGSGTITAGTFNVSNFTILNMSGSYTLTATTVNIFGSSNVTVSGASTLNFTNYTGYGNSQFTVGTGGATLNNSGSFYLNNNTLTKSYFFQSGGIVNLTTSTNTIRIGHWNSVDNIYTLNGGTLNVPNTTMYVGWDGQGTFNINGGVANLRGVNVGGSNALGGTINLSGGSLNLGTAGLTSSGAGAKVLNFGAGTVGATAAWSSSVAMTLTSASPGTTINTTGANITLTGALTGTGSIVKTGAANTLFLGGASTFSGGTTISQGTLQTSTFNALGTGTVTLNDANTGANNTAFLTTSASNTVANYVPNAIVVANAGTGTSTVGTPTFASPGVGTNFAGTVTLNKATTLTAGSSDQTVYRGVISGTPGSVTVAGGARTTFAATNSFVGNLATTAAGTILQLNTGTAIPDASNVDVGAGSTLRGFTGSETIAGLTGSGTVDRVTAGTFTLIVGSGNATSTFSGAIVNGSGTAALTKIGTGTLTLTGTNTYTGTTLVSGGTLEVATGGSISTAGGGITVSGPAIANPILKLSGGTINTSGNFNVGVNTNDVGTVQIDNGTLNMTAGTFTLGNASGGGTVTTFNQSGGTFNYSSGANFIMDNWAGTATANLSGGLFNQTAGRLQLTQRGSGTVNISGTADVRTPQVAMVGWTTPSSAGTINLNGGILTTNLITPNEIAQATQGTSTFNFNGGTLRAGAASTTFMQGLSAANVLAGGAVIDTNGFDVTIAQVLLAGTPSGGLTKLGNGTLTLSGANTFSGNVAVNAGTVRLANTTALGPSNTAFTKVTVASGAAVDLNGTIDPVYGYTIAGSGVGGTGAITNSGGTIGNGTAQTSNIRLSANATIGGTGNFALLTFGYAPTTLDLAGFTLTKAGTNTFTLANATITAGSLNIAAGSVTQIGNNKPAGHDLSNVAVSLDNTASAALNLNNLNLSVGSLSGGGTTGGNVALGTGTLTIGNLGTTTTYAGVLSGTGGLTKVGSGMLTLSGANTFTGNVAVNVGTIRLANTTALGPSNTAFTKVTVASGAAVDLNGTIDPVYGYTIAGSGVGGTGAITNSGGTIGNGTAQTSNIRLSANATIGGTGNFALLTFGYAPTTLDLAGFTLTKAGTNTFTLANATITAGSLNIAAGSVTQIGNNKPAGHDLSNVAVTLANTAGARLDLNNLNLSVGSLTGGGTTGGNVVLGTGTLTVGNLGTSTSYAGVISGTGGLTKTGTGTLSLTGVNTFTGATTVNGGTLSVIGTGELYRTGSFFGADGVTYVFVNTGGTLEVDRFTYGDGNVFNQLRNNFYAININGGRMRLLGTNNGVFRAYTIGALGGTIEVPAGATYSKGAGTAANQNLIAASTGPITFDIGGTATIADALGTQNTGGPAWTATASIIKTGTGTLTFSGAGSYTGGTTISQGTLVLNNATAAGTATITLGDANTGANDVELQFGANLSFANNVTVSNLGTGKATIRDLSTGLPHSTNSGAFTLNRPTTLQTSGTADHYFAITGKISGTVGTLTIAGVAGNALDGGGNNRVYFAAASGVNDFVGNIVVLNNGKFQINSNQIPDASNVQVDGILQNAGGVSETIASFTGSGEVRAANGGGFNFTVGFGNADGNFSGRLVTGASGGNFIKIGSGTQILTNTTSTFNQTALINDGTLQLGDGTNNGVVGTAGINLASATARVVYNLGADQTFAQPIVGSGSLSKLGASTLTLSANNTYAGSTTISAGTLQIGAGGTTGTLGTGGAVTNNGSLVFNRSNTYSVTNAISGNGSVLKTGVGTVDLNAGNSYSGNTTISQGTLTGNNSTSFGSGTITLGDANTGVTNVALFATATSDPNNPIVVSALGTGTATLGTNDNGGGNNIFGGTIELNRPTTLTGDSDRTTFTNVISGNVGTLTIARSPGLSSGTGRVSFDQNNTFVATQLNILGNAILQIGTFGGGTPNQIPDTTNVDVATGGFLWLVYDDEAIAGLTGGGTVQPFANLGNRTLTIGSGNATSSFAGTFANGGASTLAVVKIGTGTQTFTGASTATGGVTVSDGELTFNAGGLAFDRGVFTGAIPINISAGAQLNVANEWNVSTTNNITVGGTLNITAGNATDSVNYMNNLTLNGGTVQGNPFRMGNSSNSTITVTGATPSTIAASIYLTNNAHITGTRTLTINVADVAIGSDLTISAPIRDLGQNGTSPNLFGSDVIKTGTGELVLAATNTYTGFTQINAGKLLVNGSLADGAELNDVIVNSAGTLGGTGIIFGNVQVNGGTIAPGASPGILSVGSTVFTSGSTFDVEINGLAVGTQYDQLDVTGSVDLGSANLVLDVTFTPDPLTLQTFVIIQNDLDDPVTGTFLNLPEGSAISVNSGLGTLYISYRGGTGNDVILSSQPIASGTLGADTVVLTPTATGYDYTVNGGPNISIPGTVPFTFEGFGGDDYLLVNVTSFPLPEIDYDGGDQDFTSRPPNSVGDILRVVGTGGESATYTPSSTTPGSGTVVVSGVGGGTIRFQGLEPVDITGFAIAYLDLPSADDELTLTNGFDAASGATPALVVSGTTDGVAIEAAHFFGNTTVVIDTTTVDGSDTITIASASNDHGNVNLAILTGGENDAVNFTGSATFSGAVAIETVDINLSAGTLQVDGDLGILASGNVSVLSTATISANDILVDVADDVTLAGIVTAQLSLTINVDALDITDIGTGSTIDLTGSTIATTFGTYLNGGTDEDTFILAPQSGTEFYIFGDSPAGTDTGDELQLSLVGITDPTLMLPGATSPYSGSGSGQWNFGSGEGSIFYGSIEELSTNGASYHLSFDNDVVKEASLIVMLDSTGTRLQLRSTTTTGDVLFQGTAASILSLTINGNTEAGSETVTIDDVNGLPMFSGTPVSSPDNASVAGTPGILFNGNAGTNTLSFNLVQAGTSQLVGLGDGLAGADSSAEVLTTNNLPESLSVYGTSLSNISRTDSGLAAGALTILAEGGDDVVDIAGNVANTDITTAGYATFRFSGNNYSALNIFGGLGADELTLGGYGSGQTDILPTTLDGDTASDTGVATNGDSSADTLRVISTSGNTGAVTLRGGAGNDEFFLGDSTINSTVDNIVGPVIVAGEAGTDTLNVDDQGSIGDKMIIVTETTIDGITGAAGTEVSYSSIEVLNLLGGTGNDMITANMDGAATDLVTASLNGGGGDDTLLLSGVANLANLYLLGGAGNDSLGTAADPIIPTATTQVILSGEAGTTAASNTTTPLNPTTPTDGASDEIFIDISSFTTAEVVDTGSGQVISIGTMPGHAPLYFNGMEEINLYDGDVLTNVGLGDLYLRSTDDGTADNILFYRGYTSASDVLVRMNNRMVSNTPFRPTTRVVAYGRGGGDSIQLNYTAGTIAAEFHGEDGNDNLLGSFQNDLLVGGAHNDHLIGMDGNDILWGDQQALAWAGRSGDNSVGSTDGDDILEGTAGDDFIFGGGGNDLLNGMSGNDYLHGGFGNDNLVGGDGNDFLRAGDGNDTLVGDAGDDIAIAGAGDDFIYGSAGRDFHLAGADSDRIYDLNDNGEDISVTETLTYDEDLVNASYDPNNPLTFFGPNDVALLALMTSWTNPVDSFATRAAAASAILLPLATNDGAIDYMYGNTLAQDYSIVVTGADYANSTGDLYDSMT